MCGDGDTGLRIKPALDHKMCIRCLLEISLQTLVKSNGIVPTTVVVIFPLPSAAPPPIHRRRRRVNRQLASLTMASAAHARRSLLPAAEAAEAAPPSGVPGREAASVRDVSHHIMGAPLQSCMPLRGAVHPRKEAEEDIDRSIGARVEGQNAGWERATVG